VTGVTFVSSVASRTLRSLRWLGELRPDRKLDLQRR